MTVVVDLGELEGALQWVSFDGTLGNNALVSRSDGTIHYVSADNLIEEELPDDIEDEDRYWSVPHKNDLDLGRSLVFRYVGEALPEEERTVRGYFHRRGAYARFKDLLVRCGHLDRWHEYERRATLEALAEWARECGFEVRGPLTQLSRTADIPGTGSDRGQETDAGPGAERDDPITRQ